MKGSVLRRLWWRSLALQAIWNPQRMQNLGLLATFAPWVRWRGLDDDQRRLLARRYLGFFNTNPYLASYVLGGLVRLEDDRAAGREVPERMVVGFRDTLSRACGAIGDDLFWLGLRPAVMALAALASWTVAWWLALVVVGLFALGQLHLRWRGLVLSYRLGAGVVTVLAQPGWHRAIAWARRAALLLTGLVVGVYFAGVLEAPTVFTVWRVLGCLAVGLALPALIQQRRSAESQFLLGLVLVAGIVLLT